MAGRWILSMRGTLLCILLCGAARAEDASWPDTTREAFPYTYTEVKTEHLAIDVIGQDTVDEAMAAGICAHFGAKLLRRGGPWGQGLFTVLSCAYNGRVLSGGSTTDSWRLVITTNEPGRLSMQMFADAGQSPAVAAIGLTATPATPGLLGSDALFATAVAAALLNALPAASYGSSEPAPAPSGADAALLAYAPRQLKHFKLVLVQPVGLWRASEAPAGEAAFSQDEVGPGQQVAALLRAAEVRQQRVAETIAMNEAASLSLRSSAGRSDSVLPRGVTEAFAGGFIGTRFGRELINPKGAVLPATNLYGVLAEFRGGWAKGLRLYFDDVPRLGAQSDYFLSWQRIVLGWGLDYSPSGCEWVGRCTLEVAPKLGVWSADAQLPVVAKSGQVVTSRFVTKNQLSLGYEVSASVQREAVLARIWHARDTSVGGIGSHVSSLRYGFDVLFGLPAVEAIGRGTSLGLLLFAFQESLSFRGQQTPTAQSGVDADQINKNIKVGLATTYGGVGATMAW